LSLGRWARRAGGGALWLGVAAVLAVIGGRFGRRAAMRGLLSAGLVSLLANRPLKGVAARRAAVGFAFAAGAAQEMPPLAAPLLAAATGVAWPRLPEGGHHPADVVGGGALGAATAVATRRLWPVAPHDPADVRTAMPAAEAEASPDGQGLVVVVNAAAGSRSTVVEELREALPEADVIEIEDGDELSAALEEAATRAAVLGVAGGDGSVNAAAMAAADHAKPLLVVPGGTLNHFALALGLCSVADAAQAARQGTAVAVDRSMIDGKPFLNAASIGAYAELVDAREKLEGTIGKWPAVAVALWRVLGRTSPVDVEIDGQARKVWMVFVGNCRYHPAGFAPSWRERLDDGDLDIRTVDGSRPWARTRLLVAVLTGTLSRCGPYQQRFARRLHVRSLQGPLRLARDGETFDGSEEFDVCKADEPLVVYAPGP
jgi:diacylglycerol kinase family enzyme